ncbi:MAG: hypothetical protein GY814_08690 [Gammaproteobacteria bacterium]|nr:hypothetical protein [Gammaproteobacteria bacterium]
MNKYAIVRIGSKLDKALLSGENKSVSPVFTSFDIAETKRIESTRPELFRIVEIQYTQQLTGQTNEY